MAEACRDRFFYEIKKDEMKPHLLYPDPWEAKFIKDPVAVRKFMSQRERAHDATTRTPISERQHIDVMRVFRAEQFCSIGPQTSGSLYLSFSLLVSIAPFRIVRLSCLELGGPPSELHHWLREIFTHGQCFGLAVPRLEGPLVRSAQQKVTELSSHIFTFLQLYTITSLPSTSRQITSTSSRLRIFCIFTLSYP